MTLHLNKDNIPWAQFWTSLSTTIFIFLSTWLLRIIITHLQQTCTTTRQNHNYCTIIKQETVKQNKTIWQDTQNHKDDRITNPNQKELPSILHPNWLLPISWALNANISCPNQLNAKWTCNQPRISLKLWSPWQIKNVPNVAKKTIGLITSKSINRKT